MLISTILRKVVLFVFVILDTAKAVFDTNKFLIVKFCTFNLYYIEVTNSIGVYFAA